MACDERAEGESNGGQGRNRTADTAIFRRSIEIEANEKVGEFSRIYARRVRVDVGCRRLK